MSDLGVIQRVLYAGREGCPFRRGPHPEIIRYHGDGDLAIVIGDLVVGGARCRLFTADNPGYGFIDEEAPEIAVWKEHFGKVGSLLLAGLAASAAGFMALSVNHGNPAGRPYERPGYRVVSQDEASLLMVKRLGGGP